MRNKLSNLQKIKLMEVFYFTGSGNSRCMAEFAAQALDVEAKALELWPKSTGILFLISLFGRGSGTKAAKAMVRPGEPVLLFGPVWGGLLIAPLRGVLSLCRKRKAPVVLVLSCGSPDEKRYSKWGYQKVLDAAKKVAGEWLFWATAVPVSLGLDPMPEDKELMHYRLEEKGLSKAQKERIMESVHRLRQTKSAAISEP